MITINKRQYILRTNIQRFPG